MSFVEQLCKEKKLDYIDLALAREILGTTEGDAALFIAHLSAAVRFGNLCIRVDENGVFPEPQECWRPLRDREEPLSESEKRELCRRIALGARVLPSPLKAVVQAGDLYYLYRTWHDEASFTASYRELVSEKPHLFPVGTDWEKEISDGLLPEQKQAICLAMQKSLTIISGGPGTGKTFTAGQLIRVLKKIFPELRVALAAPTGKAAANLQASLGGIDARAYTLHHLLQMRPASSRGFSVIDADLILVDEGSMIDARMMRLLFSAVPPGARLILLGDRYQLPPIEAGSLFSDLALSHPDTVELKTCVRAELASLVNFGSAVKNGDFEKVLMLLKEADGIERLGFGMDQKKIIEHAAGQFRFSKEASADELLRHFEGFRILTPLRKGPFGTEQLNALIFKELNSPVVPIIVTRNSPRHQLFNGETGLLFRQNPDSPCLLKGDYAVFPGRDEKEKERKISALLLPDYAHAYCLSIHKSQGSEYSSVLILLPEGSQVFGRELFYTAVTRTKRKLELLASDEVLKQTLAVRSFRLSGFQKSLSAI